MQGEVDRQPLPPVPRDLAVSSAAGAKRIAVAISGSLSRWVAIPSEMAEWLSRALQRDRGRRTKTRLHFRSRGTNPRICCRTELRLRVGLTVQNVCSGNEYAESTTMR